MEVLLSSLYSIHRIMMLCSSKVSICILLRIYSKNYLVSYECLTAYTFTLQFVGVIQAILTAGKQLKKLVIEDTDIVSSQHKTVHSSLLRRLISTASSSIVLANAVKLLSCLNKDAADQGDTLNLFIASVDQFPEVNPSLVMN